MASFIQRISAFTSRLLRWFALLGLWCMTCIFGWQVFARYVLNASPSWTGQAALLLMIWYVLLGTAAGVREGFHIRISIFADRLQGRAHRATAVAGHLAVALFGIGMIWWGVQLVLATSSHAIPALGLGRHWAYLPLPIAGLLIALYAFEHIVAVLQDREVTSEWS